MPLIPGFRLGGRNDKNKLVARNDNNNFCILNSGYIFFCKKTTLF